MSATPANLEAAMQAGAHWLESSAHAERWQIGTDEAGDGLSEWYCRDCGAAGADPSEGCQACGYGQAEPDDDDDDDNQQEDAA
jgi:rubrerythrin